MKKNLEHIPCVVMTHPDREYKPFILVPGKPLLMVPTRNNGRGFSKKVKILPAPGALLLSITDFLFPKKIQERIFIPIIDDMRQEYYAAMLEDRIWKGRWMLLSYRISFIIAFFQSPIFDLIKLLLKTPKAN